MYSASRSTWKIDKAQSKAAKASKGTLGFTIAERKQNQTTKDQERIAFTFPKN